MKIHFLVEINVLHDLETEREITEENVNTEKTDDAEVAQHAIQRSYAVLSDDLAVKNERMDE